ncbi:MAG: flagellar hook-basal body complex protein, partial [Desulfamplus sp.]|nr:flagellar hook-basal body complex protein [Desulfamplus sp.]
DTEWEYMVATPPADDKRTLVQGTEGQGLLAKGVITFSPSSGDIVDISMYRFEGRIGNLDTKGGENKVTDVHFKIKDNEKMKFDGYGFNLTYATPDPDGDNPYGWTIDYSGEPRAVDPETGELLESGNYGPTPPDGTVPPDPYDPTVVGVYVLLGSDDQNIKIDLNGDGEADLEIKLDKPAAAGNQITFDINAPTDIHVQSVDGDKYLGDTRDGNTTIKINDPMVMTKDLRFVDPDNIEETPPSIVWNNEEQKWIWGTLTVDPDDPDAEGELEEYPFSDEVEGATSPFKDYPFAKVYGDKDKAYIDLDGSGGETDKEDIVFEFAESLTKNSSIIFNINGTNAWTKVEETELEETGYFDFKTDFLGGEFGATESMIQFNMGTQYVNQTWTKGAMSTTQFAKASTTVYQDADGYPAGSLEGVDVSIDGTITGLYSNGELIPLFRVGLAKFLNNNGLFSVGGNLFRQTRDSGEAITNKPGENGLGTLSPNSLEMSNVDISEEFVKMITTQRGFQANSKTITTVDDMLNTVIGMKR